MVRIDSVEGKALMMCNSCGREKLVYLNGGNPVQCPECGSRTIRTRITTGERVCIRCGHVWKKTKEVMKMKDKVVKWQIVFGVDYDSMEEAERRCGELMRRPDTIS